MRPLIYYMGGVGPRGRGPSPWREGRACSAFSPLPQLSAAQMRTRRWRQRCGRTEPAVRWSAGQPSRSSGGACRWGWIPRRCRPTTRHHLAKGWSLRSIAAGDLKGPAAAAIVPLAPCQAPPTPRVARREAHLKAPWRALTAGKPMVHSARAKQAQLIPFLSPPGTGAAWAACLTSTWCRTGTWRRARLDPRFSLTQSGGLLTGLPDLVWAPGKS